MKYYNNSGKPLTVYNSLFYRNLKESIRRNTGIFGTTQNFDQDVKIKVEYQINNHGYRGKDFGNNEEVMVLGCSHTFGVGIPEEFTWGNVFAKKINKDYVNLSQEGDSAQAQVYKAFKYFEEFGNPKIIVACLPSTRIEFPYISKKFGKPLYGPEETLTDPDKIQQIFLYDELEKYSKIPHNPEKILPIHSAIFYSFMFVQMLEQYCNSNKITLIWNMWDDELFFDYVKDNLPEILKNYLYIDFKNFAFDEEEGIEYIRNKEIENAYILPECHQDLADHPLFYRASDYNPGLINGHWGIHLNQHIAEDFYNKYIDTISNKEQ